MLLAFDIGNSNIVIALFAENKLIHKWRIISDNSKSADDYAIDIVEIFLTSKVDILQINHCIIGSVVPSLTKKINEAVNKINVDNSSSPNLILEDVRKNLPIQIELKNKSEVGIDRLVNAIIGYQKFGGNLIIIDFGTATTFDVVGSNGEYLGGAISPGLNLSLKALYEMTAQLPKINIRQQKNVIGKNTFEAMNSGVFFGYIALIEGMVARIENEIGIKLKKIITGGIAEIFKNFLNITEDELEFDNFYNDNDNSKHLQRNNNENHLANNKLFSSYISQDLYLYSPNLTLEGLNFLYQNLNKF
jgi:type III pantothenate kinase